MPDTIEAEVLEIDGAPPPQPRDNEQDESRRQQDPWQAMRGRVLQLDRRWWPLWLVLGAILLVLAVTVGLVFAAGFLVIRVIGGILRFLLGGGSGGSTGGGALTRRF